VLGVSGLQRGPGSVGAALPVAVASDMNVSRVVWDGFLGGSCPGLGLGGVLTLTFGGILNKAGGGKRTRSSPYG
jgi:hypothetical protein